MRSNPKLLKLYRKYNRKYFSGELPECVVFFNEELDGLGHNYAYENDIKTYRTLLGNGKLVRTVRRSYIEINQNQHGRSWRLIKTTLLHEMVHVKLHLTHWNVHHGPRFQTEMLRLAKAGAFEDLW